MSNPIPVLMVHNRYRKRGGEDVCFEADVSLLREHGHPVTVYEADNERLEGMGRWEAFSRTIWSRESQRDIAALIRRHKPAVMHVHNFFPLLSPSIYYAARRLGLPVVQQLHNYRLICPNALLSRSGRVCEDCLQGFIAWPAIRRACYRDSRSATLATAAMLTAHRMLGTWKHHGILYLAVSRFARDKYIEGGLNGNQIVVRPNYLGTDPEASAGEREGGVFAGMLLPWKGVDVLLDAWRRCRDAGVLTIAGSGPQEASLRQAAADDPRVVFKGMLNQPAVFAAMRRAKFLVFPSIWYETFGLTMIEAFACGTPVIASRLGAAADIVRDGVTGLHFQPGDALDLARKIDWALAHPDAMQRMRQAARREYETHYAAPAAYKRLIEIYQDVSVNGSS